MQTRIGHLHISYRLPKNLSSASLLVPTLERIARERIADVCDRAFDELFANDTTVHVIRKVSNRVAVLSGSKVFDSRIADQWGHRLCAAVVKSIVDDDPTNVISFDNQAEFVTAFLTELTTGDAWSKWYYGAFNTYRDLSISEAILEVLNDNQEWLLEIFRRLRQTNMLESILKRIEKNAHQKLWLQLVRGISEQEPRDAFQIFVRSAISILDSIDDWSSVLPTEDLLLDMYLATKPSQPQWTNAGSLADVVADVVQFIVSRILAEACLPLAPDQVERLKVHLDTKFDWLDRTRLIQRVTLIFETTTASTGTRRNLILRPFVATTRQRRLLEQLSDLVKAGRFSPDLSDEDPHANLLRLLALLTEVADVAEIKLTTAILESVVHAWLELRRRSDALELISSLRRGVLSCREIAHDTSRAAALENRLRHVAAAGEPAIALVEHLLDQSSVIPDNEAGIHIETPCAGLFLMTRTIQDVRLQAVLNDCEFPHLDSLLAGLSIYLGGAAAWRDRLLEEGAALWAGIEPKDSADKLKLLEVLEKSRFEIALDDQLAAQRLESNSDWEPEVLQFGDPLSSELSATIQSTADKLLRAWARWLPGLNNSSRKYLHGNFIRRCGTIVITTTSLNVTLQPGSLDEILRLGGYLDETQPMTWLGNRSIRFQIRRL